uniref:Uncharacterized protein n=1 Tax=Arundo donax TaxID=35708 RepID=A0A0A9LDV8_ARUDO
MSMISICVTRPHMNHHPFIHEGVVAFIFFVVIKILYKTQMFLQK